MQARKRTRTKARALWVICTWVVALGALVALQAWLMEKAYGPGVW